MGKLCHKGKLWHIQKLGHIGKVGHIQKLEQIWKLRHKWKLVHIQKTFLHEKLICEASTTHSSFLWIGCVDVSSIIAKQPICVNAMWLWVEWVEFGSTQFPKRPIEKV